MVVPAPMQVVMVVVAPLTHVSMLPVALLVVVQVAGPVALMAPGAGAGALVRNPVSSMKANPEGVPVPVSNAITGTSDEFKRLGPTTY